MEQKFAVCFPNLTEENWKQYLLKNDLALIDNLYSLRIKNQSGYNEACQFCGDKRCEGCPIPFDKNITVKDYMRRMGIESNVSFYNADSWKRGKSDMILELIWGSGPFGHLKEYIDFIQMANKFNNQAALNKGEEAEEDKSNNQMQDTSESTQSGVTLYDCLKEFEKPEQLDEDNMWYCS